MKSLEKTVYPRWFLVPAIILFGLFFLLPLLGGIVLAFTNYNSFNPRIRFIGLKNFSYLFRQDYFPCALGNTFFFAVATTILKTLLGLLLALGLNHGLKSQNFLRALFYLPAILSSIIIGIMFSVVFRLDGLVNNGLTAVGLGALCRDWLGARWTGMMAVTIAEVWKWSGFNMAIFLAGMQAIPDSLYEAARIDGTSGARMTFAITLPLLMPAVSINMTSNLIGGLRVFELVLVLTGGGPGHQTQVLNTIVFEAFSQGYYGRASAMSTILTVVTLAGGALFYSFLSRKEVEA